MKLGGWVWHHETCEWFMFHAQARMWCNQGFRKPYCCSCLTMCSTTCDIVLVASFPSEVCSREESEGISGSLKSLSGDSLRSCVLRAIMVVWISPQHAIGGSGQRKAPTIDMRDLGDLHEPQRVNNNSHNCRHTSSSAVFHESSW